MWYQDKDTEQFRSVLSDLDTDTVKKILSDFGFNECYMGSFCEDEKTNMFMSIEQNDRDNMEAFIIEILGKNGCNYAKEWEVATQTLRNELLRMMDGGTANSNFRFDLSKWEDEYWY